MIHNVYLGLESFYIGPLRNEICSEAVASVASFGYAHNVCTCIYVHMHKCAKMVILVMINPVWSLRIALTIPNLSWSIYLNLYKIMYAQMHSHHGMYVGVCIYLYILVCSYECLHGGWWYFFQYDLYFRIMYIVFTDFTELSYSI